MTARPGPLFSVVVPTHDRPASLPVAVASVLAQTVTDLEVVVVDDAGPIAPVLPGDDRIRVVRHDTNRGPAASRNTGAAAATGRYLAFLDDDDVWVPHRLELALAGLARAPLAVCRSRYADEVSRPRPVLDGDVHDVRDVRDVVLDRITPMCNATALDRDAFVPLDEHDPGSEDVAWWLAMAQQHDVATVPEVGVVVGRHDGARGRHGDEARGTLTILQVITDTDRRGAQVFATDLAGGLRARGHHVTTVALAPGTSGAGLDVEVLGPTRRGPRTLLALRRRMAAADVVVAHGSTTLPACAIASTGLATPFVYRQISDSLFWAPTRGARRRVALLLTRAAGVVSLADGAAQVLADRFGVDPAVLAVVPNGVPPADFSPVTAAGRAAARARLGLDPDVPVVLSISALVPEKGVDRVIDAVAELDRVQLVIAGDGPERPALERRAVAREVRAHFTGSVADTSPLYHAADVVVLASRGGDSMPATLIEAGLCGLPSVATPVGAIADVIEDGRTGVIVPIDDHGRLVAALASLVTDPARRAELGAAARARCEARFVIDVVAGQWEAALRRAAAPRRRPW